MTEWQRDNPWRQGFILSSDSVKALDLVYPKSPEDTVVVVISHDCDLAQSSDAEPYCEVIVGLRVDNIKGNLANAKNIRRLHLPFSGGEIELSAEFNATDKKIIGKSVLINHQPATTIRLTRAELTILQNWLAVRYRRSSFADEFDRRIKNKDAKFYEKFVDIIKKSGTSLLTVLFDVNSGEEANRAGPDDTYTLSILLVFNVEEDPAEAESIARSAAERIEVLFRKCFFVSGKWRDVELRDCDAVSEAAITLHAARLLKPWHFDYLSLREEPQGPFAT